MHKDDVTRFERETKCCLSKPVEIDDCDLFVNFS